MPIGHRIYHFDPSCQCLTIPHPKAKKSEVVGAADLTLNMVRRQIKGRGETARLTPKECQLLGLFMGNSGKILNRELLMKKVWETDYVEDTRTLDSISVC